MLAQSPACLRDRRYSDALKAVIKHPGVVGVAFEANPVPDFVTTFNIPAGVAYVRSLGLDCFVLAPPFAATTNYTSVRVIGFVLARGVGGVCGLCGLWGVCDRV